jgi:uncharacterized protein YecT (DUF1311 family)
MYQMRYTPFVIGLLFLATLVEAASFNCSDATTKVEKLICSDSQLSKSDEDLMVIYVKVLKEADDTAQIKKQQREWLGKVRNLCADVDCLRNSYATRITQLSLANNKTNKGESSETSQVTNLIANCFNHLLNVELPFKIYWKEFGQSSHFIQARDEMYGFSTKAVPFIERAEKPSVAPLCNGNYITIWAYSHERFPVPLTGRIFDVNFKSLSEDFPISENNNLEKWEYSVSPLYNYGFVVTWKTWKTATGKGIKLRGRIFDDKGKPTGQSFDIYAKGDNNGGYVYGLANGNFVVVWQNSDEGALLRIFDKRGKPITKGIIIDTDSSQCMVKPRAYLTKDDKIIVFTTCQSSGFDRKTFFHSARVFDYMGKPMTDVLLDERIKSLDGYNYLVEQYVKEKAELYDSRLRKFKKQVRERKTYCRSELISPSLALETKTFTNEKRMKKFFANYCLEYENNCIVEKYEENTLKSCAQGD